VIGDTDQHHCHRCQRLTRWEPTRRGARAERCTECGDRFPCRNSCTHADCARVRQGLEP